MSYVAVCIVYKALLKLSVPEWVLSKRLIQLRSILHFVCVIATLYFVYPWGWPTGNST